MIFSDFGLATGTTQTTRPSTSPSAPTTSGGRTGVVWNPLTRRGSTPVYVAPPPPSPPPPVQAAPPPPPPPAPVLNTTPPPSTGPVPATTAPVPDTSWTSPIQQGTVCIMAPCGPMLPYYPPGWHRSDPVPVGSPAPLDPGVNASAKQAAQEAAAQAVEAGQSPVPVPGPAAAPSGLVALATGAGAGFLVGGPIGAGVGGVLAYLAGRKK
jgi:hypothetical protein